MGIEVKAGGAVNAGDFGGLRRFAEVAGKKFVAGVVLYDGQHSLSFGPNLAATPIQSLWM